MLMWHIMLEKRGYSIFSFAKAANYPVLNLYNWANGKNLPSVRNAIEFWEIFNNTLNTQVPIEEMWLDI